MVGSASNIPARILRIGSRVPDADAIVDGDVRLTYRDLSEQIPRATRAAIAAGLRPGDRAAIWAPNGYRWILAALGVLGAGGTVVPINTRFKAAEAGDILRRSDARLLFTDSAFLGLDYPRMLRDWQADDLPEMVILAGDAGGDTPWEQFLAGGQRVTEDIDSVPGSAVADVLFTSGTTGRPKGAMATHEQLLRLYDSWSTIVGLTEGDRYLVVTPFFHSFGYKAGWLASLLVGATVLPMPTLDLPDLLALVERERVTFLPGPPTLLQDVIDHPDRGRYDLSSLRTTVMGASLIPVELVERLRDEGVFETVLTGYGLTETNGPATICRQGDTPVTIATTVGRALPGTEARVVGPDGAALPPGEPGEVLLRGYHLMVGYLGDEAATAAALDDDGWLHTGDVGTLDEHGYLTITDRMKEMFIVGGFNVYPAEVETLLLADERLARAAVIGIPDPRLGEVGVAFVVPRPGRTVTAEEIIADARGRMANYKVPRRVTICETLPTNALGKVLKEDLRALGGSV